MKVHLKTSRVVTMATLVMMLLAPRIAVADGFDCGDNPPTICASDAVQEAIGEFIAAFFSAIFNSGSSGSGAPGDGSTSGGDESDDYIPPDGPTVLDDPSYTPEQAGTAGENLGEAGASEAASELSNVVPDNAEVDGSGSDITPLAHDFADDNGDGTSGGTSNANLGDCGANCVDQAHANELLADKDVDSNPDAQIDANSEPGDDPVHKGSGALRETWREVVLPGIGLDFVLERVYSSGSEFHGPLGHGWNHSYNQRLFTVDVGCAKPALLWRTGRGVLHRFYPTETGYDVTPPAPLRLVELTTGGWLLTNRGGLRYIFDANGLLRTVVDLVGNTIYLTWKSVPDDRRFELEFAIDTVGRIVHFQYDEQDRYLTTIEVLPSFGDTETVAGLAETGILPDLLSATAAPMEPWVLKLTFAVDEHGDLVQTTNSSGVSEYYTYSTAEPSLPTAEVDYEATATLTALCKSACGGSPYSCQEPSCDAAVATSIGDCHHVCEQNFNDCPQGCQQGCRSGCRSLAKDCLASCTTNTECASYCERMPNYYIQECKRLANEAAFDCQARSSQWRDVHCFEQTFIKTELLFGFVPVIYPTYEQVCYTGELLGFNSDQSVNVSGRTACPDEPFVCADGVHLKCDEIVEVLESDCDSPAENDGEHAAMAQMAGFHFPRYKCVAGQTFAECIEQSCNFYYQCSSYPDDCETYCYVDQCMANCLPPCEEECSKPMHLSVCQDGCTTATDQVAAECATQCTTECVAEYGDPAEAKRYGRLSQLRHNLTSIADDNGVWLTNEYGIDPYKASFDRVVSQQFGSAEFDFRYYDLLNPDGLTIATDDGAYVDVSPVPTEVCPCDRSLLIPGDNEIPLYDDPAFYAPLYEAFNGLNANSCVTNTTIGYLDAVEHSSSRPLALATVVRDDTGAVWTYYSDEAGRVLRTEENSGIRKDRSYDALGRLVGERTPYGDRHCYEYDEDFNRQVYVHLPAPGVPSAEEAIVYRYVWEDNARLLGVYHPNSVQAAVTLLWDKTTGLLAERRDFVGPGNTLSTTYAHDARGRVTDRWYPGGARTHIEYQGENELSYTMTRNADGLDQAGSPTLTVNYDFMGRFVSREGNGVPTTTLTRSPNGRVDRYRVTGADFPEYWEEYEYDVAGNIARATHRTGVTEYTYYPRGKIHSVTGIANDGSADRKQCFRYDGQGRLAEQVTLGGQRLRHFYHPLGGRTLSIAGLYTVPQSWDTPCYTSFGSGPAAGEQVAEIQRDNSGLPVVVRVGLTHEKRYYDGFGRLIQREALGTPGASGTGRALRIGYDDRGRISWQGNVQMTTTVEPDLYGFKPPVTDPNLMSLNEFAYDGLGRIITRSARWFVDNEGSRTLLGINGTVAESIQYDDELRERVVTNAEGLQTRFLYDPLQRLVTTHLPDGSMADRTYADHGLRVTDVVPMPTATATATTTRVYDERGSLRMVTDGTENVLYAAEIDWLGRVNRIEIPSAITVYERNSFGDMAAVQSEDLVTGARTDYVSYQYDGAGQLVAQVDGNGNTTYFTRDNLGRVDTVTRPNGEVVALTYFAGSNKLATRRDEANRAFAYEYDSFGRLAREVARSNSNVLLAENLYQWDIFGLVDAHAIYHCSQVAHEDIRADHITFRYDSLGRVVEETSSLFPNEPATVATTTNGSLAELAVAERTLSYSSDPLGRVSAIGLQIGSTSPSVIANFSYYGLGAQTSITYGNGLVDEYGYDQRGRLRTIEASGNLRRVELVWDAHDRIGRIDQTVKKAHSSLYGYDSFSRLAAENHGLQDLPAMASGELTEQMIAPYLQTGDEWQHRSYDFADNLTTLQSGSNSTPIYPQAGPDNRYTDFGGPVDTDAVGRILTLPDDTAYYYDVWGRLMIARTATENAWQYGYDPIGRVTGWAPEQSGEKELSVPLHRDVVENDVTTYVIFDDYKIDLTDRAGNVVASQSHVGGPFALAGEDETKIIAASKSQNDVRILSYQANANTKAITTIGDTTLHFGDGRTLIDATVSRGTLALLRRSPSDSIVSLFATNDFASVTEVSLDNSSCVPLRVGASSAEFVAVLDSCRQIQSIARNENGTVVKNVIDTTETLGNTWDPNTADIAVADQKTFAISTELGGAIFQKKVDGDYLVHLVDLKGRVNLIDRTNMLVFLSGAGDDVELEPPKTGGDEGSTPPTTGGDSELGQRTILQYALGRPVRHKGGPTGADILYVPGMQTSPVALIHDETAYFIHAGQGGRIQALSNASGQLHEYYQYTAFGKPSVFDAQGETQPVSQVDNRMLIDGQPFLYEVGLQNFGLRMYRPAIERWMTPDPGGFIDGPNRFAFVGNDPLHYSDPTGLGREGKENRPSSLENVASLEDYGEKLVQDAMTYQDPLAGTADEPALWEDGWGNLKITTRREYHDSKWVKRGATIMRTGMEALFGHFTGVSGFVYTGQRVMGEDHSWAAKNAHAAGAISDALYAFAGTGALGVNYASDAAFGATMHAREIDPKQGRHYQDSKRYKQRIATGKGSSTFFSRKAGDLLTRYAWANGSPDPKHPNNPNIRVFDYQRPIGRSQYGDGVQHQVRACRSENTGQIHGHPYGPVYPAF